MKLTAEEPTATWSFDEEDDDEDFLMHTLFLRHVSCQGSVHTDLLAIAIIAMNG